MATDSDVILEIHCPSSVYQSLRAGGLDKESLQKEAQISVAVRLFADGRLSLGKAAEFAGVPLIRFMDILRRFNVPIVEYGEEEFVQDIQTIEQLRQAANHERAE